VQVAGEAPGELVTGAGLIEEANEVAERTLLGDG
jgi:hypothetical protein